MRKVLLFSFWEPTFELFYLRSKLLVFFIEFQTALLFFGEHFHQTDCYCRVWGCRFGLFCFYFIRGYPFNYS